MYKVEAGLPYPKGATFDGRGVNFAVFSENANAVEVCLFDADGRRETARIRLPEYTNEVYHGLFGAFGRASSMARAYMEHYAPAEGHRFNPNKLLLDPYAKQLHGNCVGRRAFRLPHRRQERGPFLR